MTKDGKICPLISTVVVSANGQQQVAHAACAEVRCAWWLQRGFPKGGGACSALLIAEYHLEEGKRPI